MSIFYGIYGKLENITHKVHSCEKRGNNIIIPAGDGKRAEKFGDPVYGQLKHIQIKKDDKTYVYPHYVEASIPFDWFTFKSSKWVIIVTCLMLRDYDIRKEEYLRGISSIIKRAQGYNVVIVENNGKRPTFLDDFGIPVLYTSNNLLPIWNQGAKEQLDIKECIDYFGIQDDDFIVKITGRYYLDDNCNFFDIVDKEEHDAVIRYGNYRQPAQPKTHDCIVGLIGMKCKYVKQIKIPDEESLELDWGKESMDIKDVYLIDKLGIWLAPGSHDFFLV